MAISDVRAVQTLYVAYFGRPADPDGLAHWAGILALHNGDVSTIRAGFSGSEEYRRAYDGLSIADTVQKMYGNLFGRPIEPAGLAYWSEALASGKVTIDLLLETVAGSAQGTDAKALAAKVDVAERYTLQLKPGAGYSETQLAAARALIASVTDEASAIKAVESLGVYSAPTGTSGDDRFFLEVRPLGSQGPEYNGGAGNDTLRVNFDTSEVGLAWPSGGASELLTLVLPDSTAAARDSASWSVPARVHVRAVESFVFKDGPALSRADIDKALGALRPLQWTTLAEALYQAGFGDLVVGGGTPLVRGTNGSDRIAVGATKAYLFGDAGDDQFIVAQDAAQASHVVFGGTGTNSIDYSAARSALTLEHGYSARGPVQNWTGIKSVVYNGAAVDSLYAIDKVTGSAFGDTFYLNSPTIAEIDGGAGQDGVTFNATLARTEIVYDQQSGVKVNNVLFNNVETITTVDGFTLAVADLQKVADAVYSNRRDVVDRMLDQGLPVASSKYKIVRGTSGADEFRPDAEAALYFGGAGADSFIGGSGKDVVAHYLMGGMDLGNSVSYAAADAAIVYANTFYPGRDYAAAMLSVINGRTIDYLSHVDRITGSAFDDRFYVELADAAKDNPSMIDGGAGIDTLVLMASYETHDIARTANGALRYGDLAEIRNIERVSNHAGVTVAMTDLLKALETFEGGHARLNDVFKKIQELGMTLTQDAGQPDQVAIVGMPQPAGE